MTDGAIYRTKIHCYFLDQVGGRVAQFVRDHQRLKPLSFIFQSRVVKTPCNERNYHIFYQMLAGLSSSEKSMTFFIALKYEDLHSLCP